ncbi:MAG: hypothetical protein JEZ12_14355 [Desulfobacterium sp.]|nr:hypothetical protein [Desulfobacterium sp.]
MKKLFSLFFTPLIVLFMSIAGCGLMESRIARLTTDFKVLPSDNRILYESGAEVLAHEAARHLPAALENVALKQYGTFKEPITVYAFASTESFSKFSGISKKAMGASVGSDVYLSGMLSTMPEKVYGMIGHELSHVQFSQTLGIINFNRTLPRWFREGLAIYVSDGGGAPRNFEKETLEKFIQKKHFLPVSKGALFNRSLKTTDAIGPRMFYSQSGMFVGYMAKSNPLLFKMFVTKLQSGNGFKSSFFETYGIDVDEMLNNYIERLPPNA